MEPYLNIIRILNRYRRGEEPTRAQLNTLTKNHYNMKKIINHMPLGLSRMRLLQKWNNIGNYLNKLNTYLNNRNVRNRTHRPGRANSRTMH